MRTTLNISDALLDELKRKAAEDQVSFRKTLEDVLQRGLSNPSPAKRIRIEPAPVGVKAPYQGLSMNQLYDELELDEPAKTH